MLFLIICRNISQLLFTLVGGRVVYFVYFCYCLSFYIEGNGFYLSTKVINGSCHWSCPTGWTTGQLCYMAKTATLDITCTHFSQICFIPAMLIGTRFLHFRPFSVTLTLDGNHKGSAKQNLLFSFITHFSTHQD